MLGVRAELVQARHIANSPIRRHKIELTCTVHTASASISNVTRQTSKYKYSHGEKEDPGPGVGRGGAVACKLYHRSPKVHA